MWFPELLIPSIISLICVLVVTPWHIRIKNLSTLSMIFWMGMLDLCHIVNCTVWANDADNRAPVWCDLSTTLQVGYNFGLPLSHLLLARQLASITSIGSDSILFDEKKRQREKWLNRGLCFGIPIVGILLHLAAQDRRFYILQGTGCFPATYWNWYGLILVAIIPVLIALLAVFYTLWTFFNIYRRQRNMSSILSSNSKMPTNHFIRLYILGCAEIGTCLLRAVFNLTAYANGPQPLNHLGEPYRSLTVVSGIWRQDISDEGWKIQLLQWYTVTACSIIFFLCFATASETVRMYRNVAHKICPWISSGTEYSHGKSNASSSSALNSKRSNNTFSSTDKLVYQRDTEIAESGPEDTYQLDYVYKSDDNQFAPSSERKVDGNPFHENIRSRIEDEIHSQRVNLGNVSVRVSLDERRRSGQATEDAREVKSVVMA